MTKEEKIKKLEKEIGDARNNLTTDRLDMSFGEIISMYEREEIFINPDFQRLFRWKDDQKTKLIGVTQLNEKSITYKRFW